MPFFNARLGSGAGGVVKETIGKYASRPVIFVEAEATVRESLLLMCDKRISCTIVLAHGEPIGILTERDVVFAANWLLGQPELLVKEVMNKPVLTGSEEMTIAQAYQVFSQYQIRHLVVLDARLDMVGVFTQSDLVRSLRDKAFVDVPDISSLMSKQVLHVAPEVPARYALSLMARRSVSCVVVLEDGRPVGMLTERDVVRLIAKGVDLTMVSVREVMCPTIVTTPVSTSPYCTIDLMRKKAIRRLLVTNDAGEIAGILTQTDLGRILDRQPPQTVSSLLGLPLEGVGAGQHGAA